MIMLLLARARARCQQLEQRAHACPPPFDLARMGSWLIFQHQYSFFFACAPQNSKTAKQQKNKITAKKKFEQVFFFCWKQQKVNKKNKTWQHKS
jgi:hypothetical protein